MRTNIHIILFLLSFSILTVIHIFSLRFFLYFHIGWLDMFMHILGAIVVVFGIFSLGFFKISLPNRLLQLFPVLVYVLIVSLLWEMFKLLFVITVIEDDFIFDTVLDIVMDLVGGGIGYFLSIRLKPK